MGNDITEDQQTRRNMRFDSSAWFCDKSQSRLDHMPGVEQPAVLPAAWTVCEISPKLGHCRRLDIFGRKLGQAFASRTGAGKASTSFVQDVQDSIYFDIF
jgi:hypothetical protein